MPLRIGVLLLLLVPGKLGPALHTEAYLAVDLPEPWRVGVASWYGPGYYGRRTASGEIFTGQDLTFAHRTLPFGTVVEFKYGGKVVVARCNDMGPYIRGRDFDLSERLAEILGMKREGVVEVMWRVRGEGAYTSGENVVAGAPA